jgi:hypothetical protein
MTKLGDMFHIPVTNRLNKRRPCVQKTIGRSGTLFCHFLLILVRSTAVRHVCSRRAIVNKTIADGQHNMGQHISENTYIHVQQLPTCSCSGRRTPGGCARGAGFGRQYVTSHPDQSYPEAIVKLRRAT